MDKPGKWNTSIAALAGLIVFIGYSLFPVDAFTPEMSAHAAVVAGIRPPETIFPGLWRFVAYLLPANAAAFAFFGRLMAGLFAAFAFLALRGAIAFLVRPSESSSVWSNRLAPAVSFVGVLTMSFADPVWRVFSLFAPSSLFLLFVVGVIVVFEGWIVKGGWWRLCLFLFLAGAFAAETPLAVVFPVGFVYAYLKLWRAVRNGSYSPRPDLPHYLELPIWRMFLSFTGGFLAAFGVNIFHMILSDMSGALGWKASYAFFHYWAEYIALMTGAANVVGWLLGIGLVLLPFAIVLQIFPRVTNDDTPMPFPLGLTILLCGLIAYFEQGPLRGAWFWTWIGERESVSSASLLSAFSVLSSATLALSGAIFVFDAFNVRRQEFRDLSVSKTYRISVMAFVALVALLVLPTLSHSRYRAVLSFNDSAIRETVRELNGATCLFTDGSADAALELEARRNGQLLNAINLMAADSDFNVKLRLRALQDAGDVLSAKMGAPVLLRVWACDKTNGLDNVALQLGLALWKREATLARPVASAFLARTRGLRPEDVADAGKIAKAFAERIKALTPSAESADVPPAVRREFFAISWRLSRMARYRHDVDLADALESMNSALRRMLREIEYERLRVFMQFTPREGLEFALRRADFTEAARYAAAVLRTNKDDARANFGLGMYYLSGNRLSEAEKYLRRVLVTRPDEPAALNNISIICRKTRRYDEALKLAKRAKELLPDNEDVNTTYQDALRKAP